MYDLIKEILYGGMYLTVDSLIEINKIINGSSNIT